MAVTVKPPKPGKTGTPKGMEGVRPGSPQAIAAGFKPPTKPKKPGGAPFAVSFNANGTTTLKLPAAPAASIAAPTPTAAPVTPFNYANAFLSDPRYATGLAGITQSQLGIEQKYGIRLRRAQNGLPIYRVIGGAQGSGNVTTTIDPTTGATKYVNAAGVEVSPATLELDYEVLKPGDPGYSEGAIGTQTAGSQIRQLGIGDTAAQAGARRSGMRASAQLQEGAALQAALRGLTTGAASEFGGTTTRYADLLNLIYPDLVKRAGDYSATPPAAETPAAEAPAVPVYAGQPTDQTSYMGTPLPPSRSPLSAGPTGEFMRMITSITEPTAAGGGTYGWKDQITSLEKMKTTYSLTPQQIKYVDDKIAAIRKANTKTSNTTTPAPSAPAPAPSRPAPAPAPIPKPTGAGAMYERRGPWQYLGKARGWVKVG